MNKSKSCVEFSQAKGDDLLETSLFLPDAPNERLRLPKTGPVDEYLGTIPRVVSRTHELMQQESLLKKATSLTCLNVLQGEVAHASALQTEVVVSAEATTCHVVALRSTKSESVPLVSLAHVDKAGVYDSCLEAMLQQHVVHHQETTQREEDDFGFFIDDDDDEPQEYEIPIQEEKLFLPSFGRAASMPSLATEPIEVELHLAGGFLDKHGASQELSSSLVSTFSKLADKYKDKLRISLSTAAISSLNTDEDDAPKSRGLGIDTRTGKVFPVTSPLPEHLHGPAVELRSARAWVASGERLSVIHDTSSVNWF